ncbi:MAG TPA: hypothetical protein VGK19_07205 [Capsulimonadaceae bacterium]
MNYVPASARRASRGPSGSFLATFPNGKETGCRYTLYDQTKRDDHAYNESNIPKVELSNPYP